MEPRRRRRPDGVALGYVFDSDGGFGAHGYSFPRLNPRGGTTSSLHSPEKLTGLLANLARDLFRQQENSLAAVAAAVANRPPVAATRRPDPAAHQARRTFPLSWIISRPLLVAAQAAVHAGRVHGRLRLHFRVETWQSPE